MYGKEISGFTQQIREALGAPFPDDEIEFLPRAVSGSRALGLPYLEARDIMRRLDDAVGPEHWSYDFELLSPDGRMVRGKLTVLGVTKCDAGEAASEDELLKSAVSDALKRCAVHFGIGRYLYYLPKTWAPYDAQRRQWTEPPRLAPGAVDRALAICGIPPVNRSRSETRPTTAERNGAVAAPAGRATEAAVPAPNGSAERVQAAPGENGVVRERVAPAARTPLPSTLLPPSGTGEGAARLPAPVGTAVGTETEAASHAPQAPDATRVEERVVEPVAVPGRTAEKTGSLGRPAPGSLRVTEPTPSRPAGAAASRPAPERATADRTPPGRRNIWSVGTGEPQPEATGDRAATRAAVGSSHSAADAEPPRTPACAGPNCGRALTRGQLEYSTRMFGQGLCPACQKQQQQQRAA